MKPTSKIASNQNASPVTFRILKEPFDHLHEFHFIAENAPKLECVICVAQEVHES